VLGSTTGSGVARQKAAHGFTLPPSILLRTEVIE
jgi:hypothetical protein